MINPINQNKINFMGKFNLPQARTLAFCGAQKLKPLEKDTTDFSGTKKEPKGLTGESALEEEGPSLESQVASEVLKRRLFAAAGNVQAVKRNASSPIQAQEEEAPSEASKKAQEALMQELLSGTFTLDKLNEPQAPVCRENIKNLPDSDAITEEEREIYEEAVQYGNEAIDRWDLGEALVQYSKALEIDNADASLYYKLGIVHEFLSSFGKAIDSYSWAISHGNADSETYFRRGETRMYAMYSHLQSQDSKPSEDTKKALEVAMNDEYKYGYFKKSGYWNKITNEKAANAEFIASNAVSDFIEALKHRIVECKGQEALDEIEQEKQQEIAAGNNVMEDEWHELLRLLPHAEDTRILNATANALKCCNKSYMVDMYLINKDYVAARTFERSSEIDEAKLEALKTALAQADDSQKPYIQAEIDKTKAILIQEHLEAATCYKTGEGSLPGQYNTQAYSHFKRYSELGGPEDAKYHAWLAQCAPSLEECIKEADTAAKMEPDNASFHMLLSRLYKTASENVEDGEGAEGLDKSAEVYKTLSSREFCVAQAIVSAHGGKETSAEQSEEERRRAIVQ